MRWGLLYAEAQRGVSLSLRAVCTVLLSILCKDLVKGARNLLWNRQPSSAHLQSSGAVFEWGWLDGTVISTSQQRCDCAFYQTEWVRGRRLRQLFSCSPLHISVHTCTLSILYRHVLIYPVQFFLQLTLPSLALEMHCGAKCCLFLLFHILTYYYYCHHMFSLTRPSAPHLSVV